jgi:prepilin-type N-terminal cleavage/methylation domain-containing protein
MKGCPGRNRQHGFSLIELLTALGIFLLIAGAAFTLLSSSQQRYQTESQALSSFQEARLGLDQMVRDINDAGFPPPSFFSSSQPQQSVVSPFAWSAAAGYPNPTSRCAIGTGGTCFTSSGDNAPGDFDIIIETNPNPTDPNCGQSCVQWIRYQLQGTTLMRAAVYKTPGTLDPDGITAQAFVPFVQNVVNNSPTLQIGQIQLDSAYPAVFGGGPVPIFQYTCDTPSVSQALPLPTAPCATAAPGVTPAPAADNCPTNIRDVLITLIVAAPVPDSQTGRPRLIQLEGRGRRVNPNQLTNLSCSTPF